jgi:hypothetical protein
LFLILVEKGSAGMPGGMRPAGVAMACTDQPMARGRANNITGETTHLGLICRAVSKTLQYIGGTEKRQPPAIPH